MGSVGCSGRQQACHHHINCVKNRLDGTRCRTTRVLLQLLGDEILLFQLCLQHSESFRSSLRNRKQFWIKISGLFERTAKRPYSWQSVKRKIEDLTSKRKVILEAEETGTTQISEDPLDQVIDQWLEIWNAAEEEKKNQKLSKSQQEENVSMATEYHENLLQAMSQKQLSDSEPEDEKVVEVEKESLESSLSLQNLLRIRQSISKNDVENHKL